MTNTTTSFTATPRAPLFTVANAFPFVLDGDTDHSAASVALPATSVLSYWREYFQPQTRAPLANHSTGLIAARLYRLLSALGSVTYYDNAERPRGLRADLFVGHFWSFAKMCDLNRFERSVAVYTLSDPLAARAQLQEVAARRGVPMPDWDLPPPGFDHEATMERADLVLLCGNSHTLATFPSRWRDKIRLFNYALEQDLWAAPISHADRRSDFAYVATHCGLRKGFLDVIATWRLITPGVARLHVIGHLDTPYDAMLAAAKPEGVIVHGWIDSASIRYQRLLRSCRFAYIPTWVEGQMGTLLEAIFAGCIPITTAASGVDDELLAHCIVVDAMRPHQHRRAIEEALSWSPESCQRRSDALQTVARRRHNWSRFDYDVGNTVVDLLGLSEKSPVEGTVNVRDT
jgi:glycosyltransferase involved in cell wall biosynthesis